MIKDINQYARALYSRIEDDVVLRRATIEGGDWEPAANMCHHNVTIWCTFMEEYQPVRGWLYFDLPGLDHVKFLAHSAVRTPEGEVFNITPSNASQDYPFLESQLAEEEYAELVETKGYGGIHYFPGKG